MNLDRLNIGELNLRATYYGVGTSVSDGMGGYVVTDGEAVETWCSVKPLNMAETLRFGLADGSNPCYFGFRYEHGKNINQGGDILFDGVVFRVRSVIAVDEARDTVVVFAVKKV